MRYLVLANTPAHVHLYRNAIEEFLDRGHEALVLARDYGCTLDLLEWFDLPHEVYGSCGTSKWSLARHLPGHFARIARAAVRYDPDLVFGMGAYAAFAGTVSRTPVVLLLDSEPTRLDTAVSRRVATAVLTPAAFRRTLGPNHYVFSGFKESAYLHPDVYTPRADVRRRLGLAEGERYAIVRFNAFGSHHDVGAGGFSPTERRELVERLAEQVTVLVSDEGGDLDVDALPARPFDTHPALLHDALAHADLLVADTQTIVTEAALLGTPAIRSNSFVGPDDMGNFLHLEEAGLVVNLAEFEDVVARAEELLADDSTARTWQARRTAYVREMVNLTDLIVEVATNHERVEAIPELSRPDAASTPPPGTPTESGL